MKYFQFLVIFALVVPPAWSQVASGDEVIVRKAPEQRRSELRSALKTPSDRSLAEQKALDSRSQKRQLSEKERADLRQQLRQQRKTIGVEGP